MSRLKMEEEGSGKEPDFSKFTDEDWRRWAEARTKDLELSNTAMARSLYLIALGVTANSAVAAVAKAMHTPEDRREIFFDAFIQLANNLDEGKAKLLVDLGRATRAAMLGSSISTNLVRLEALKNIVPKFPEDQVRHLAQFSRTLVQGPNNPKG